MSNQHSHHMCLQDGEQHMFLKVRTSCWQLLVQEDKRHLDGVTDPELELIAVRVTVVLEGGDDSPV
jgi:hypothetical protein